MTLARGLVCAAALLALASPAHAQYMYLDSNGDGIHSAADQVNPTGPTTVDIWLDTDSNRDGSPVTCAEEAQPMTINSYEFILHAEGGAVAWSGFINRQTDMGVNFGEAMNSTDYHNGRGGALPIAPGLLRLATLTATVLTGAPALRIATSTVLSGVDLTSFGSRCPGLDLDNTLKLGSDWLDTDGLPFGVPLPGGPPSLAQPADLTTPVGAVGTMALSATDPDGQPLQFAKESGPAFLSVRTLDPGRGAASGRALAVPIYTDVGSASATVSVTDGASSDERTFLVTVPPMPNRAPSLSLPDRLTLVAGTVAWREFVATDEDGQPLLFSKVSGPDWAAVASLATGPGASVVGVQLAPTLCDVGSADLTLSATDGLASTQGRVSLVITPPGPAPSSVPTVWPTGSTPMWVSAGDLNSDGRVDLVTANEASNDVSVLLGRGNGSFDPPLSFPVPRGPASVALGDLNGDAHPDLAVVSYAPEALTILLGDGTGHFTTAGQYATGSAPQLVLLEDLDRDGHLDAVVGNTGSDYLSVFPGAGDGTFAPRRDATVGGAPFGTTVGDFNRDGRSDFAVGVTGSHQLCTLLDRGDRSYAVQTYAAGSPFVLSLAATDLDRDGIEDLAVADAGAGQVRILKGRPDGSFQTGASYSGFGMLYSLALEDLNGDGNSDIAVVSAESPLTLLFGAGDGTFPGRMAYPGVYGYSVTTGDLNGDGFPDLAVANAGPGGVTVILNQTGRAAAVQTRAFPANPDRTLPAGSPSPVCLRLEPVAGSYSNADVLLSSLTLSSQGTGSASTIPAIPTESVVQGDTDKNGVLELPACFAAADFARLFDQVRGRRTVDAQLAGSLVNGRRFCATTSLTVVATGSSTAVTVAPNPLNPSGTISLATSRAGAIRVRLFDLHGRLARTIADVPLAAAGPHEFLFDGRSDQGVPLASGVYFFRVETADGQTRGRIAVLK